jgi:hypothetical protein
MGHKAALQTFIAMMGICTMGGCLGGKISPEQAGNSTGTGPNPASANSATPATPTAVGPACGYNNAGQLLHVADNLDVCLPPTSCTSEVCPPPLGTCVQGQCVMKAGYAGIQTLPQAWATYYCQLSTGGCDGVSQVEKVGVTAQKLAKQLSLPVCEGAAAGSDCIGIAASSPMVVGNSQVAVDAQTQMPVRPWGLGLSEASNVCYHLKGPGGDAYVALTDRCGGYCKCNGSSYQECGACVNAADMTPNCPCVGTAPGVADACCGAGPDCTQVAPACDWCATNNHPHFDLDQATFNHLCGQQMVLGSCQLTQVAPIVCPLGVSWPPP